MKENFKFWNAMFQNYLFISWPEIYKKSAQISTFFQKQENKEVQYNTGLLWPLEYVAQTLAIFFKQLVGPGRVIIMYAFQLSHIAHKIILFNHG
jgi:hypothetical protein